VLAAHGIKQLAYAEHDGYSYAMVVDCSIDRRQLVEDIVLDATRATAMQLTFDAHLDDMEDSWQTGFEDGRQDGLEDIRRALPNDEWYCRGYEHGFAIARNTAAA